MKHRQRMWAWAVAFVVTATVAYADCVPSLTPISTRGVFPNRMALAPATNGSVIGLAKLDSDSAFNAIEFATFNPTLMQLTSDVLAAPASLKGPIALLWNGSDFALFYQAPSLTLMLQHLDVSGQLVGPPIPITVHGWSPADEVDVTWVAARNAYAIGRTVTIGPDHGIWITTIADSGAVLSDSPIPTPLAPPILPHVAALADGTVELTVRQWGAAPLFMIASLTPSNVASVTSISEQTVTDVRIASDGNSVLIIDSVTTSTGTTLRYARVNAAGVLTPDSPFFSGSGIDIAPRSLIWNAALSEWAFTYVDAPVGLLTLPGDTRFRRFASPAGLASDTLLWPDPTFSRLAAPFPPVFVNGAYVAAIGRVISSVEGSESDLAKLCPFIATAAAPSIESPYVPITFTAEPSGGSPGYSFSWDFGDLSSATGPVVHHAYNVLGVYTVTLTATDAAGVKSIYKFTVTVAFLRHRAAR